MKHWILAIAAASVIASCGNRDEKTAAASEEQAKTVVVEKKVYVPVKTETVQAEPEKKGWSKAAKGTVIGAGSGALIGTAVSNKKGKGAIIGAVVGAGSGYLIGRDKDRRDGRVKAKN